LEEIEKKKGEKTTIDDKPLIIHHHATHQEVEDVVMLLRTRLKAKFDHQVVSHVLPKNHEHYSYTSAY
jgi:hypothetical protein